MIGIQLEVRLPHLWLGLVEVRGVQIGPASEDFVAYCQKKGEEILAQGLGGGEERRTSIRQLLRQGGFRPSGRNKPAQEYLWRTLTQQESFPQILNVVDVNNLISLQVGLPISLVSLERAGEEISFRLGRPGERYVFNRSGQELNVEGLVCLCHGSGPESTAVASPIKDSMQAKVNEKDHYILGCLYASDLTILPDELERYTQAMSDELVRWCNASSPPDIAIIDASS